MKTLFVFCVFLLLSTVAFAQSSSPYYRQFLFNPYLTNPAFLTQNKEGEASIAYRQQWIGFKDAPNVSSFNLKFPTSERSAIGINLYSEKSVLLRTSGLLFSYAYQVPFDKNSGLSFGMSVGVGSNKLDLTDAEISMNDPVILNARSNFYLDGNAGALYHYKNLQIGFSFLDLFKRKSFNESTFNTIRVSNLRHRIYSVTYRFDVSEKFDFQPYFMYREMPDGFSNNYEFATIFRYDKKYWLGASYNQYGGIAAMLGLQIKNFSFGYSYETPLLNGASVSGHELQLKLKLKKLGHQPKTKPMAPKPILKSEQISDTLKTEKPIEIKKDPLDEKYEVHYIVVGVYTTEMGALAYMGPLYEHQLQYFRNKNGLFYVYLNSSNSIAEAREMRDEIRKMEQFKDAWIFSK